MKVCIIGAGTSGVICAKVFKQQGIAFTCYEKGSGVGGLWRFHNDNGVSSAYRSLHINTSKRMMELSDFPFPDHMAEYPSHAEILEYFENYCNHFDVLSHITFNTPVLHARRKEHGGWEVTVRAAEGHEEIHAFDHLVVANGHHWDPRSPELPGAFSGEVFHSHHYIDINDPVETEDKTVVVMGSGNSAMDIVCELGQAHREGRGPKKVILSQRSGVWIVPKVMGNGAQDDRMRHPMDRPGKFEEFYRARIPVKIRHFLMNYLSEVFIRKVVGDPRRFGLKQPKESFSMRHPTVSQDVHSRLVHGDITAKGNITGIDGKRVVFEDGSTEQVDVIVQCTGYDITFPFFDRTIVNTKNNDVVLYQRIFDPNFSDVSFIGLVQTLCAIMPIAELQSHYLADYLKGDYQLPPASQMEDEMRQYHEEMKGRFTASRSHTIQINCNEYSYFLYKEWDAGKQRQSQRP